MALTAGSAVARTRGAIPFDVSTSLLSFPPSMDIKVCYKISEARRTLIRQGV